MITTLEAIYENGIFKPVSSIPANLREHERVKIIIESEIDEDLKSEIAQWEAASDEDFLKFENSSLNASRFNLSVRIELSPKTV